MDRRALLAAAAGGIGLLALPGLARSAMSAAAGVTRLSDRLSLITGVGSNVLALDTGNGLLVVDSGAPGSGRALQAQLKAVGQGGRVVTLFNTHWHLENTANNELLAQTGAKVIAQEKTRLWLSTDRYLPAEDRYEKARPKAAQATEAFYTEGKLGAGAEHVDYGYLLEAHTDGDCYVQFREANVIAVGDAVSPTRDPQLDWHGGGWLGGRIDALALLIKRGDAQTRYVPTFGPVVGRDVLQAEHDVLSAVFTRMAEMMRKGYRTEDMLAGGLMEKTGRVWQDAAKFANDAHKGMWAHHNTLSPDIV
jgi:glyoxylase-like metal-dependent hydrolase (beta-lactamase superfamily II)